MAAMEAAASQTTALSAPSPATRLPSLDGWRAVSILLVLGTHCAWTEGFPAGWRPFFEWTFNGNLGVRFFFVLSGFLITHLLVAERGRAGDVNLRYFYVRRALRIFPVYFAFLGVLFLLQTFTAFRQSAAAWAGCLTFTRNFVDGTLADPQTSRHLWSLAAEEQFYLVWPCVFAWMIRRNLTRFLWAPVLFPVALAPIVRVADHLKMTPDILGPVFASFSFFKYCDTIAIGCAGALFFAHRREWLGRFLLPRAGVAVALAAVLIVVPHVLDHRMVARFLTVPAGPPMQALGFLLLVFLSILKPSGAAYRVLNAAPVRALGVLSYSIYIWQQIFWTPREFFGAGPVWWLAFPGMLVASIAVAALSYYGLEKPFLRLRARYR